MVQSLAYDNGVVRLYQGDARELPLADESVDCVVTSPPYWGLRDYSTDGQIGLETTPDEYVCTMVDVFREVWRVLKPTGTVWVNLGDSYAGSWSGNSMRPAGGDQRQGDPGFQPLDTRYAARNGAVPQGLKPKDLVGIPWRVAFALQADGWYLRSDCIWSKPNPMPESVTDRPTKAHEYVFLLSKSAHYFYDAEAVREVVTSQYSLARNKSNPRNFGITGDHNGNRSDRGRYAEISTEAGRNKRTVWEIATQAYPGSHFATFPEALVEPCILAGTSAKGVCGACGKPWERVVEASYELLRKHRDDGDSIALAHGADDRSGDRKRLIATTTDWQPTCSCDAPTVPSIVLDPFIGSGTTAAVAQRLGRRAIGVDLSPDYLKLAAKRVGKVSLPMKGL